MCGLQTMNAICEICLEIKRKLHEEKVLKLSCLVAALPYPKDKSVSTLTGLNRWFYVLVLHVRLKRVYY